MNADPRLSNSTTEAGATQEFIIDGCKITVRYSSEKNPSRVDEIKSLLLSAQFKAD